MRNAIIFLLSLFVFSFSARADQITATFVLKKRVTMEQLASNVYDPKSPHYGVFYTPEEIRDIAAPTKEKYDALIKELQRVGLRVTWQSRSRFVISVRGDHTVFESVFKTKIKFSQRGRYHKNVVEPKIPANLNDLIVSISGLDNTRQSKIKYKKLETPDSVAQPGILPETLKKAYGFDSIYRAGISGKDQNIAIATYDDFILDNVTEYYRLIDISPTPNVDKVQFNGTPQYDTGSATETELDAELAGMIAPGSNIHVFTSAENSDQGELLLFTNILDDNRSKVVNYSWGSCETQLSITHREDMDKIFARAIAQGVNIFVASGDNGSDGCGDGGSVADWPALHPYVIAVGGTTISISKKGIKTEKGWTGSGGGFSSHYTLPKWQSELKDPFIRRSFPDVSFNADPASGEAIWTRTSAEPVASWQVVGGTSMAAPQWTGFIALVNEVRQSKNMKTLGFLNPLIYKATEKEKIAMFVDVTEGSNGAYFADRGWDAVTGWGSMRAYALLDYLTK